MLSKSTTIAVRAMMCLLAVLPVAAEPAPAVLAVGEAVAAALRNNLSLKSTELTAVAKKRARDFSFNKFYPTISTSATALRMNNATPELLGDKYGTSLGTYDYAVNSATYYVGISPYDLALGLTIQEVFSPSYLLEMNQTALDYQSSDLERAKAEKQMKAAVKETFYQLLVQKEAIALTKARLDNASEQMRLAKVSYDLGQGSELDYMNTEANVEGLIPELRSMETARRTALAQFQQMLGLDDRPDMELSGSLDDEKIASEDDVKLEGQRFDLLASELSVKNLESALKLQDSSLLPNIVLQYKADPTLNDPSWNNLFNTGSGSLSSWQQSSGAISLSLSWDLSQFLPGSDYYLQRQHLREQLDLAKESERQARSSATRDEADQLQGIKDELAKIKNLRVAADAEKRAYELTNAIYKAGSGRYLDLQSAEIGWQSSQIQLLTSRLDLLKLLYDFEAKYQG